MLSRLLAPSKIIGNNHLKQNVICKRWSGHNNMEITPSNYDWKLFKDMLHFYVLLGGVPVLVVASIISIRANPELTEIPEGYTPRHWEYFKHPVTRWMAKYWFHPPELEQEVYLGLLEYQSMGKILRAQEEKATKAMKFYNDHRSRFFQPMYGEYHRISRDDQTYGITHQKSYLSRYYDGAYEDGDTPVPVEGYRPEQTD